MAILDNAGKKIGAFNLNPKDLDPKHYHDVLLARCGAKSIVDKTGSVSDRHLKMIDKALRGYFMMNRGNRMGNEQQFVNRLNKSLANVEVKNIFAKLRNADVISNLTSHKLDARYLYLHLSNPKTGLSPGTYYCVGTTKLMHCLFPELFVMLDRNVAKTCGYSTGYNNFTVYWSVMEICHDELIQWRNKHGGIGGLLHLDSRPTSLTRIFDKCAITMALGL